MAENYQRLLTLNFLDLHNFIDLSCDEPDKYKLRYYEYWIWQNRLDLQKTFDINIPAGRKSFLNWCSQSLVGEYGYKGRYISDDNSLYKAARSLEYFELKLKLLNRYLPRCMKHIFNIAWKRYCRNVSWEIIKIFTSKRKKTIKKHQATDNHQLNIIGYMGRASGVGHHARNLCRAFDENGIRYKKIDLDQPSWITELQNNVPNQINLIAVNADQLIPIYLRSGLTTFEKNYNILYPFWELSKFPEEWVLSLEIVDEIWAPTKFIKDAVVAACKTTTLHMPVALDIPKQSKISPSNLILRSDSFVFLTSFDFSSHIVRKNPWAVIKAFRDAFALEDNHVSLVVKTMNEDKDSNWKNLLKLIENDPRIQLIQGVLSYEEVIRLKMSCDCYVSLHRAEGLGMDPMEAMALCKPVIITNYSGSTDYANNENAIPIDYELVDVKPGEYVKFKNQVWAEPNIQQASEAMRELARNEIRSNELGKKGFQDISMRHNLNRCGARYSRRVRDILNKVDENI